MSLGLLGNKIGMTQLFDHTGCLVPVTIIKIGPCYITQIKTVTNNGYNAIQLGYNHSLNKKRITKPEYGHLVKNNLENYSTLKEFKIENPNSFFINQKLTTTLLNEGELISISAISIGKGTTGNIKRHHFKRGPMSHGSKHHRLQGSLGAGTSPGRVFPGKKMSGHSGNIKCTLKNLEIIRINHEKELIAIKGAIPGKFGNLIIIKKKSNENS